MRYYIIICHEDGELYLTETPEEGDRILAETDSEMEAGLLLSTEIGRAGY